MTTKHKKKPSIFLEEDAFVDEDKFIESIQHEDFSKISNYDNDTSDTGSVIDENDYLSDEEVSNKYTFIKKTVKQVNNQYKKQFIIDIPKNTKNTELKEEEYLSD